MSWRDDWPSIPDGKLYDGMNRLQRTLDDKSPFGRVWDVRLLIRGEGEMIGWEGDDETVGPVALAAKPSLLRAIPYLLPVDDSPERSLCRPVIEHGGLGIHNTTITIQACSGEPLLTSLFDWETTCVWPALLSGPLVAVIPGDFQYGARLSAECQGVGHARGSIHDQIIAP